MMRACQNCGASIVRKNAQARYCSTRCRVAAHRRTLPSELTSLDRWVRFNAQKAPLTITGDSAKSTDPATWTDYQSAKLSTVGVGLGFVLNGDGITCIDIDHCVADGVIDPRAVEFVIAAEPFYVEISPSGDGIHAWTHTPPPGTRRRWTLDNGLAVEWYTDKRYLTVTGERVAL